MYKKITILVFGALLTFGHTGFSHHHHHFWNGNDAYYPGNYGYGHHHHHLGLRDVFDNIAMNAGMGGFGMPGANNMGGGYGYPNNGNYGAPYGAPYGNNNWNGYGYNNNYWY